MRRSLSLWLFGIILLAVISFLGVFQPITFSPRKDPSDSQSYLRPLGSRFKGSTEPPDPFTSIGIGNSKLNVYFYVPQHNLRLGLDLRGGMRVVLDLPNRAEMSYLLTDKIADPQAALALQGKLTTLLKGPNMLPVEAKPNVTVTGDGVRVDTLVKSREEADAQLRKVNDAMNSLFGAGKFTGPKDVSSVYKSSGTPEQTAVGDIMGRRLNAHGLSEITIYPEGTNRVVLEIPGVKNQDEVNTVLGTQGQMEFRLIPRDVTVSVDDATQQASAVDAMTKKALTDDEMVALVARSQLVMPGSALDGKSKPVMQNNKWAVAFTIKKPSPGEKDYRAIFSQVTRDNRQSRYGQQDPGAQLAIILDGKIFSAPYIQSEIDDNGIITGSKDQNEASNLSIFLNAGALPVPVQVLESRSVSATLGQDSINMSMIAGIVGLIAVLIFMAAYYRLPGLMADMALIVYIALTLGVFKFFDATLTLPGIAGLIISIGMAVDANVIIFERLKEELRSKKPLETAIDTAFARAWTAILDSNMASLITGTVLYFLGTGAVKGFAITLMIGVAVSMFTAVTVTRLFLKLMVRSQTGHNLSWYGL